MIYHITMIYDMTDYYVFECDDCWEVSPDYQTKYEAQQHATIHQCERMEP